MMSSLIKFVRQIETELESMAVTADRLTAEGHPDRLTSAGVMRMIALAIHNAAKATLLA